MVYEFEKNGRTFELSYFVVGSTNHFLIKIYIVFTNSLPIEIEVQSLVTGRNVSTGGYAKQIILDIGILSNNTGASISISVIGNVNS